MKYHIALQSLFALLRSLYDRAEITRLLGLQADQDETFWEQQQRTVSHRTYAYLLAHQHRSLALDRESLSPADACTLYDALAAAISAGLTYEKVRYWWLVQGQSLHRRAIAAEREARQLQTRALGVLVFFEGRRPPRWLGYDSAGTPVLHMDRDAAHRFPVYSPTDLTLPALAAAAEDYTVLCKLLGATCVKVLPLGAATEEVF